MSSNNSRRGLLQDVSSLADVLYLTIAFKRAPDLLSMHFDEIILPLFKRTVPSDFRQLIWAILSARRTPKPKGQELQKFFCHIGDAQYPLWPSWAPKTRATVTEIATLIADAGWAANLQQACKDNNWQWHLSPHLLFQAIEIPRKNDLGYYIFELYATLFHTEAGAGASEIGDFDQKVRMNDHDAFLAFFASLIRSKVQPPNDKTFPLDEHLYATWHFCFLYQILLTWCGGHIAKVMGEKITWAVIAYQLSFGLSHLRKLMIPGTDVIKLLRYTTDWNFLPKHVVMVIKQERFRLQFQPSEGEVSEGLDGEDEFEVAGLRVSTTGRRFG
jgi:hypothetical protein